MIEAYEVIFPYRKDHSELCPVCVPADSPLNGSDDPPGMVRRSPDVYQCDVCGLLILAGYDRYKMGKRIILGHTNEMPAILVKQKPKK